MPSNIAPPPLQTPIVSLERTPGAIPGQMTKVFADWLRALVDRAQASATAVITLAFGAQTASLGLTTLIPVAASGLYRVSYRFRIATAGGVSSSLEVAVASTEGGIACLQSSAAYTGNVTNRPQSGAFVVKADPSTPIQVQTTYASVGTPMAYDIDVRVEQL